MNPIDRTHDASALSWVAAANDPASDFPLQNLPFCTFRRAGTLEPFRVGVGIGDQILDLSAWGIADLNALMARPGAERLAGDERTRNIPVVFLSARAADEDRLRAQELGAVGYVVKPFDPVELAGVVRDVLERVGRGERDELNRDATDGRLFGCCRVDLDLVRDAVRLLSIRQLAELQSSVG